MTRPPIVGVLRRHAGMPRGIADAKKSVHKHPISASAAAAICHFEHRTTHFRTETCDMATSENPGGCTVSAAPAFRIRCRPEKRLRTNDWRLVAAIVGISPRQLRTWRHTPGFPIGPDGLVCVVDVVNWSQKEPTE